MRTKRLRRLSRILWLALATAAGMSAATSDSGPPSGTIEVTFHPDRVYEVTGIWIKKGRQQDLADYFGDVFPIAAGDYGVRPLFGLEPIHAYAGDFVPHVLFVNEWPSLESFQGFLADRRAQELFPLRDAAISRLVVTQYRVPSESTVSLTDGDVVEFGALWIKDGREEDLRSYYQEALAIARRHGLRPVTPLEPVFSYRGSFLPSRAGLNWWGELESFEAFRREAEPLFHRRDDALDRLEVTHARVRLEGEQ